MAQAQFTTQEWKGIDQALYLSNMNLKDLEYERRLFTDPYRLSLVDAALKQPVHGAEATMELHRFAEKGSMSAILSRSRQELGFPAVLLDGSTPPATNLEALPEELRSPVGSLIGWVAKTNAVIRLALEPLNPAEKRQLIEGLPTLFVDEPRVKFDFVKGTIASRDTLLALLKKVDVSKILQAGADLAAAQERIGAVLRKATADVPEPVRFISNDLKVGVFGRGADRHDETDLMITIDLGGNDSYSGRHGVGVGYASVLVDLGGSDSVQVGDLGMGAGILGVGLAKFSSAGSSFRGGDLCFGAGVAGVGAFANEGGDDEYRSGALSQGAAMMGVGVLLDNKGDDTYRAQYFSQGASSVAGLGWLVDRTGRDLYQAGGLVPHEPLIPGVTISFSQGFSTGWREDSGGISGGIGLLTDFQGDDTYRGETYCQGASYWFALGSLFDANGHDQYSAYHYSQASAMHFTVASLFDLAGDDAYTAKWGASHAIGHDYGVAVLLDRTGNDIYSARDSNPSVGVANGVSIFVDSEGDDRYMGPPAQANASRGTGSLAVFVDLAGADKYREGLEDGAAESRALWGMALDFPWSAPVPENSASAPAKPAPGSLPLGTPEEMEALYRTATQWQVGSAVDSVAQAVNKLVAMGMPAFEWMVDSKLERADRLQIRAFEQVMQGIGADARLFIAGRTLTANDALLGKIVTLAAATRLVEIGPALPGILAKPALQRAAVRLAGEIGAKEASGELQSLAASKDIVIATNAMVALGQIKPKDALGTATAMLQSENVHMRMAAIEIVGAYPVEGMEIVTALMRGVEERKLRVALQILGKFGTPEALEIVGTNLRNPLIGVRIDALKILAKRCPEKFVADLNNLKNDRSDLVRAMAKRLLQN